MAWPPVRWGNTTSGWTDLCFRCTPDREAVWRRIAPSVAPDAQLRSQAASPLQGHHCGLSPGWMQAKSFFCLEESRGIPWMGANFGARPFSRVTSVGLDRHNVRNGRLSDASAGRVVAVKMGCGCERSEPGLDTRGEPPPSLRHRRSGNACPGRDSPLDRAGRIRGDCRSFGLRQVDPDGHPGAARFAQ